MRQSDHLEALHLLREDPRLIDRSIARARQLRAEANANAWRSLRDMIRRLARSVAIRRPRGAVHHSNHHAQAQS